MQKTVKSTIVTLLVIVTVLFGFTACGNELNFGKELVKVEQQIDILTELTSGTADVGVMDSIMARYYMLQDTNYSSKLMIIEDLTLANENYGIAAKKGSIATITKINMAIVELTKDGTVGQIAERYGLTDDLVIDADKTFNYDAIADKSDWNNILAAGEFVVGYTVFAPIAYDDGAGNLIGFDIELAEAVAAYYGLDVEFQVIEWSNKENELNSGTIDFVWNGMTISDERKAAMEIGIPYLANKQVAVIRKTDADKYKTTGDMKKAYIAVESGSAGQSCVEKATKK